VPAVVAYFFCVKTPEKTNAQKSENVLLEGRLFLPVQRSAMSPMPDRQKEKIKNKKKKVTKNTFDRSGERSATKCRYFLNPSDERTNRRSVTRRQKKIKIKDETKDEQGGRNKKSLNSMRSSSVRSSPLKLSTKDHE
jgi:hypothetical protein